MKIQCFNFWILTLLIAFVVGSSMECQAARVFGYRGETFPAEVVRLDRGKVTLKRGDNGMVLTVSFSELRDTDVEYLKKWHEAEQIRQNQSLRFKATLVEGKSPEGNPKTFMQKSGNQKVVNSSPHYLKFEIMNNLDIPLKNVEIDYYVFVDWSLRSAFQVMRNG